VLTDSSHAKTHLQQSKA